MLDLAEDALNDDPKITGASTMATTWVFDNVGAEITSSNDSFFNKTFSFSGGFPGQLFLSNITNDDGSPVELAVYDWDDGEQFWQISGHALMFDPNSNGEVTFKYAFDGSATKTVDGIVHTYQFDGGMVDINGEWRWTIQVTAGNFYSVYHITATPSGTLAKASTQSEITDATVQSWINNNTSFLTTTEAYLTKSRDSVVESSGIFKDVIDEFQLLDPLDMNQARSNHFIATVDVDFEFDNDVDMSDSEVDGFQSFVEGLVNTLSGPATVDPTFMSTTMESSVVDLTALSKNTREYATNSSGQAIMVAGVLEADEDQFETDLAATVSSGNLFGMTADVLYGGNVSDLYGDLSDYLDDWLSNGSVNFSREYYQGISQPVLPKSE
jgi:hypothetical protein